MFPIYVSNLHITAADDLKPTHFLDMPAESTIERICYRSTDPQTGVRYHQFYDPPPSTQIAMRLIQKLEDQEDYVKNQIEDYNHQLPGKYVTPYTAYNGRPVSEKNHNLLAMFRNA